MLSPSAGGGGTVIKLGEVAMIVDLHRQGLSVAAIAEHLGIDRKTVRKYIARGLEPPVYGPRQPRPRRIEPVSAFTADSHSGCGYKPPARPGGRHGRCQAGSGRESRYVRFPAVTAASPSAADATV
jgi:hypothetical protein